MFLSGLFTLLIIFIIYRVFFSGRSLKLSQIGPPNQEGKWNLKQIQAVLDTAPAPIVHEEAFNQNASSLFSIAELHHKNVRTATKSIRVPELIAKVALNRHCEPRLMCYSVREAEFFAQWSPNFRDILIAYPTINESDIIKAWQLTQTGVTIYLMVESLEHVSRICEILSSDKIERKDDWKPLALAIDFDSSLKFGKWIHIGCHRSPLYKISQFEQLIEFIKKQKEFVKLEGVMTYEAQIAGVGDSSIFNNTIFNFILKVMKKISHRHVTRLRKKILKTLLYHGVTLSWFNGGGTGNFEQACNDSSLTEVTAGSGFLQPKLFDYYADNLCSPALTIALQVTRIPRKLTSHTEKGDIICCQSGGFNASGPSSIDKAPTVFLPKGLVPFPDEGFGEVQTPLKVTKNLLQSGYAPNMGDYILIRPSKSGEIAERFPKYWLIDSETSPYNPPKVLVTYRGFGKSFY